MSKIFEALQREKGELSNLIVPSILEEQKAARVPSPEVAREKVTPVSAPEPAQRVAIAASVPSVERMAAASVVPPSDGNNELRKPLARRILSLRLPDNVPLLPFDDTHRGAAEQYRIIRTKIIQHPKRPRVIVISSPAAGDGKSVTTVNIAGFMALKSEGPVLLVDADFRRSGLSTKLGIDASPGISEVLAGACSLSEALIQTEQLPNLHVLMIGDPSANPAELLDPSRWLAVCEELRRQFTYVLIDSPPIGVVADYDLIQAGCDGVIIVLRPDSTNRQAGIRVLQTVPKEKCIGVVMNCVPRWFLGKSFNDRYGYSYNGYYE